MREKKETRSNKMKKICNNVEFLLSVFGLFAFFRGAFLDKRVNERRVFKRNGERSIKMRERIGREKGD